MSKSILIEVLNGRTDLRRLGERDWERLIFEAGSCELTTRLAAQIDDAGMTECVPIRAAYHLETGRRLGARQHSEVAREVVALRGALCRHGLPFLLLKGGAYVVGGFKAGKGRTLSDIDILVRKADLDRVEDRLDRSGWIYTKRDAYDQEYYRRWMHELPPMMHIDRYSVLDVHHTVTPPTSAMAVEGERIFEKAEFGGATGDDLIGLPMPADLVLHSAVHLFNDSEFDSGLRDLSDLDLLFREFGADGDFWTGLIARAKELGLTSSLFFAVTLARDFFATPVPPETLRAVEAMAPKRLVRFILLRLFSAVISPPSQAGESFGQRFSAFALYIRGHGLRMPPTLLLPHLIRQAIRRIQGSPEELATA